ncbi:hypothetical protein N9937_01295, partial [bacterium]|nr:hypothetical protein [bacterium]
MVNPIQTGIARGIATGIYPVGSTPTPPGPSGPAFHALTYDPADIAVVGAAYLMKGVVTGTGGLTTTHTADLYAPDFEGVYREFGADEPVWAGGRVVRNSIRFSNDFTDQSGGWVVEGGMVKEGVVPGIGPNGEDAMELSFNAGASAGIWQQPPLAYGGEPRKVSIYVRTVSGSTSIRMGLGSTYSSDISINETWTRIEFSADVTGDRIRPIRQNGSANATNVYVVNCQMEAAEYAGSVCSEYVETVGAVQNVTKTFASTNGNTVDGSNVVTEAIGTPLPSVPKLRASVNITNSLTYSRDLTNVVWTPTNMTVSKTSAGLTGETNSACFLTATAANATIIHDAYTSSSANHLVAVWVRRVTGSGAIELTNDNGVTWTAITVTDTNDFAYAFIYISAENPEAGIRIVASGDQIEIGNVTSQKFGSSYKTKQSGPVFTTTASVAIDIPKYSFDKSNNHITESVWYCEPDGVDAKGDSTTNIYMGASDAPSGAIISNGTIMQFANGSNVHCSHRLGPSNEICTGRFDATEGAPWKQACIYSVTEGETTGNKDGQWYDIDGAFPDTEGKRVFTTVYDGAYLSVGYSSGMCFLVGNIQR